MIKYLLFLLVLVSCANQIPDKRDKAHKPTHGGVVIKGHKYFLEIVGHDKYVDLYPLEEDAQGNLVTIPLKRVKMEAEYSPDRSKADYSLYLNKRHEHFHGRLDKHGEETYQVHVDMKIGNTRESFLYNLRTKDIVHKPTVRPAGALPAAL